MAKADRIVSFILPGPLLSLDTRSERHDRGETIRGRGGPSMAAIFGPSGFFFWTRFENLVAKRRKINDRVVPISVAIRNWNDVIACQDPRKSLVCPVCCSSTSEFEVVKTVSNYTQKVRG